MDPEIVTPEWTVEAEALRSLRPRHILFMCVANAARSQLAEGIARSLAPPGVLISSAGAISHRVNPLAVRVLEEIGIDASGQRSKAVDEIDTRDVEAVVTLCAEQVCPVFPRSVPRVHWPLEDPTFVPGGEEASLRAFRAARDELRRRLAVLFDGWSA